MAPEFKPWPKIGRLNRDIIITEKIDGTNAAIGFDEDGSIYAQSRTRIITPKDDNFGFARWVHENQTWLTEIFEGKGLHFGEWWGLGIQRGYNMDQKVFSLFNVSMAERLPDYPNTLRTTPVLYEGPNSMLPIELALGELAKYGSVANPGFMKPEGIVIFHTADRHMFKVTLEGDEKGKG